MIVLAPKHAKAADPWTPRDTALQAAVLGLMWIDYRQTLDIASGRNPEIFETNPALGRFPSREDVTRYFLGAAIVHTSLVAVLPKDWRLALQAGAIGVELSAVSNNYQLGVAVRF